MSFDFCFQVSSLAKLQEELSSQKLKELSALKEKLLYEKKASVLRVEQKMADQLAKLQQQVQKVREEMVAMETEMTKQLSEEREKSGQLREALAVTKKVIKC